MWGNTCSSDLMSDDSIFKISGPQARHSCRENMNLTIDIRDTIKPDEIKISNLPY